MATLHRNVVDPQREGVDPGCGWCKWWKPFEDDSDRGRCLNPEDPQEEPTMYFNGCDLWEADWDVPAHIERLHIRGFRSLADVEFAPQPGASVLIGANGSGKSNFVHFFNMLGRMLSRRLAEFVGREGGADDQLHAGSETTPRLAAEIEMRTTVASSYRFALAYAHPDQLIFTGESFRSTHPRGGDNAEWHHLGTGHREARIVEAAQSDGASPAATIFAKGARHVTARLRGLAAFQFHNTGARSNFKKKWDAGDSAYMRADGGNLPAILHRLEREDVRRYELICRHIRRVLPGFDRFEIEEQYGKVALRWRSGNSEKSYGAHLTSDGSLRFFALVTLLNLPSEMLRDVVLLDEPELGLHPKAIALVGDMIRALAESRQVIVATQSPLLVDAFKLDEIFVLENRDGRTQLSPRATEAQLQAWLEDFSVGELWQKNLLGGRP